MLARNEPQYGHALSLGFLVADFIKHNDSTSAPPEQSSTQAQSWDLVSLSKDQPRVERAGSVISHVTAPFRWVFSELGKWWQGATTTPDPAKPVGDATGLIYASPSVKQYSIDQVADTFYHLPPAVFQSIVQHKTRIDILASAAEDPNGDPEAAAYYEPQQNKIVIYASSPMAQEAAAHEMAHAWDGPNYAIESQQGFKQAFNTDLKQGINAGTWQQIQKSGELSDPPVIGGVKAGDVFAEIFAGLNGYNASGLPGKMEQAFPYTTQFIYNTVVNQDNALMAQRQSGKEGEGVG